MGLFYTGKGDKGESEVGKKKIDKTSADIESLGELDELNSLLGVVKVKLAAADFADSAKIINGVQENLFIIQANLANFMFVEDDGKPKYKAPEFRVGKIAEIEKIINEFEAQIKPEKGFIVSGTDEVSAWLDFARAVSRRTERSVLKLSKSRAVLPEILAYLNRLSSLLFALARMEAHSKQKKESHPTYR